jgi:GntR family transcriptional regulator
MLATAGFLDHAVIDLRGKLLWGADCHDDIIHSIMFASVDVADRTPLHDQVAAQIRRSIAEGDASPGDRLPPAKDLAAVMHVNTNTVLRALRVLRDEGLLEFRRGMGVRVSGTPQQGAVVARARELLAFARNEGYKPEELIAIIQGLR